MRQEEFDVAIVGTGPAGIFAALELIKLAPKTRIVMFERGKLRDPTEQRELTCGWGGSGAFSDGKLNLTCESGGQLKNFLSEDEFEEYMNYVDQTYLNFGGEPNLYDLKDPTIEELKRKAFAAGLELLTFKIRHLGTDRTREIVERIRQHLLNSGVRIFLETDVTDVQKYNHSFILHTKTGKKTKIYKASQVIVATGRGGAEWFFWLAERLGLHLLNNGVDLGVRVEVPFETMRPITDPLYEAKLLYRSRRYNDLVRTFCMCPRGFVVYENYRGLRTVNGHSYKDKLSPNTNFALLVTHIFTEPSHDPIGFGRRASEQFNELAGGTVIVQRLGDLRRYRRSTSERIKQGFVQPTLKDAQPGDITMAMPYRHMVSILEMLEAMDTIAPGVNGDHTLLYAAEVKFYSMRVEVREGFETMCDGLYVAGDGSGYTRGLLQSSMQGVIVARHLIKKYFQ